MAIEAPARAGRLVADFHGVRAPVPAFGVATTAEPGDGLQRSLNKRLAMLVRSKITATGNRIGDMGNSAWRRGKRGHADLGRSYTRNRESAAPLLTCGSIFIQRRG